MDLEHLPCNVLTCSRWPRRASLSRCRPCSLCLRPLGPVHLHLPQHVAVSSVTARIAMVSRARAKSVTASAAPVELPIRSPLRRQAAAAPRSVRRQPRSVAAKSVPARTATASSAAARPVPASAVRVTVSDSAHHSNRRRFGSLGGGRPARRPPDSHV